MKSCMLARARSQLAGEVDLLLEDEAEGGSDIYYFVGEDGNIHSREFLAEELVGDDAKEAGASFKGKPRSEKVQRLKTVVGPDTEDISCLNKGVFLTNSGSTPNECVGWFSTITLLRPFIAVKRGLYF
jgi:hypothetical protein